MMGLPLTVDVHQGQQFYKNKRDQLFRLIAFGFYDLIMKNSTLHTEAHLLNTKHR